MSKATKTQNVLLPKHMIGLTKLKNANSRQLDWLIKWRCNHRHNGVRHFSCFLKEFDIKERIGFLDIETSNLKANFGIVLCWCILAEDGTLYEDWITKSDFAWEDKRIIISCIDTLKAFDRVITHYGTYFDIPFLRSRAIIHGLDFPKYGELYHTDVWKMAKSKLCLHSNRQDIIAESLHGKTIKTRISHPAWRKAMMGDIEASMEVLNHCEKDVEDLRKNYNSLLPYCNIIRSSI